MACIISLFDPTKNKITKYQTVSGNYLETEKTASKLNQELNKKPNPKGMYWKITAINV